MRTFGSCTLIGDVWVLEVEPHVAMRLKRVFSRIVTKKARHLHLRATDENSRELLWFLDRFPLEIEPEDAHELRRRADAFDARGLRVHEVLRGSYKAEPVGMALPPRHYQEQAAALALASGSLLLADDVGLGKTVSAIATIAAGGGFPALIVAPPHLARQWKAEVERFLPGANPHILRKGTPYPLVDRQGRPFDVLISSYHKLWGWMHELTGKVQAVVFDEAQELRHSGTDKYTAARCLASGAACRLGLSATPIYNYGAEFFSVLEVLSRGALGEEAEFLREWCVDGRRIADPKAFGSYLRERGLMLRRTRSDVGRELPPVTPIVHELDIEIDLGGEVEGGGDALALANQILSATAAPFSRFQAAQQFDMRMRMATGISKAPHVAQFVEMLLETSDDPVVLFGWHRLVYDIWAEKLSRFRPAFYTGAETDAAKDRAKQAFLAGDSRVLVISLRSGAGLDGLQGRCSRVVFGELDWSPGVHEQCIGRVHRDGQELPVMAYFVTATDGADPVMVDVLGLKQAQLDGVMRPMGDLVVPKEVDPNHIKRLAADFLARRGGNPHA